MSSLALYDAERLAKLTRFQKAHAWDLESSINWDIAIDLDRPLVGLDSKAIFFPGASSEQRLVIAQMMGLVIAASICEMEDCLMRLRGECWERVIRDFPVSPEFNELGNQFFDEEVKHTTAFRRYLTKFAEALGVELPVLLEVLPAIENTRTEAILRRNIQGNGQAFWWIVADVEQVFLHLYHQLSPIEEMLEPLYFTLHKLHFEEEARHTPFPFMMIELLADRNPKLTRALHTKGDLLLAQGLQAAWTLSALQRVKASKKLADKHPFFKILSTTYPLMRKQAPWLQAWTALTRAPYISALGNPGSSRKLRRFAEKIGAAALPFPQYEPEPLVDY